MSYLQFIQVGRRQTGRIIPVIFALASVLLVFTLSQLARPAAQAATGPLSPGWTEISSAPRGDSWAATGPLAPYRAVAFGGQDGVMGNTVLVYDGTVWRPLPLASGTRPQPRSFPAFVAGDGGRVLLYGGQAIDADDQLVALNDLWELSIGADGKGTWREVTPATGPSPVMRPSLGLAKFEAKGTSVPNRKPFYVLYGAGSGRDETWILEWAGDTYSWREHAVSENGMVPPPLSDVQMGTYRDCREDNGCSFTPLIIGDYKLEGLEQYQFLYAFTVSAGGPSNDSWQLMVTDGTRPVDVARPVVTTSAARGELLLLDAGDAPGAPLQAWVLRHGNECSCNLDIATWQSVPAPAGLTAIANPAATYDAAGSRYLLVNGTNGRQWSLSGLPVPQTPAWSEELRGAAGVQPAISSMVYGVPSRGQEGVYGYADGAIWRHDGERWTNIGGPASAPLVEARLVYDPAARLIYMIGMLADPTKPAAIWSFDGLAWAEQKFGGGPSSAFPNGFQAAFDTGRSQIVVFGGARNDGALNGNVWAFRPDLGWLAFNIGGPAQHQRAGGAFVWDPGRDRGVLFGGVNSGGLAAGTWLLTYNDATGYSWSEAPGPNPPARTGAAAAFDSARGRVVLIGGANASLSAPVEQNTVWEFGTEWVINTTEGPRARYGHAVAFVPAAQPYTLLAGGAIPGGAPLADTWAYVGPEISAPPTTTAVPSVVPTLDPTAPPVPTVGPLPNQEFMDNGVVRIWADTFDRDADGVTIVATGKVMIGAQQEGDTGKYFTVSDRVSWKPDEPIQIKGRIGYIQGGQSLASGSFSVAPASGQMDWPADVVPLYKQLGSSNLAITPTLSINVIDPKVNAVADLALDLPEDQTLRVNLKFTIAPDGSIATAAGVTYPINIKLAGGTLTADVTADRLGLSSPEARLKLPDLETEIVFKNLKIHGFGLAKLSFNGSTVFPLPDLPIGETLVLKNITGRLAVELENGKATGYRVGLGIGSLALNSLPIVEGSGGVEGAEFEINKGELRGSIAKLTLTVGDRQQWVHRDVKFNDGVTPEGFASIAATERKPLFTSDESEFPMPKAWAPDGFSAKVLLRNVRIYDEEPFLLLESGGTRLNLPANQAYYLAGDANSTVKVRFDQLQGDLLLRNAKLELGLTGQLTIGVGDDSSTSANVNLRVAEDGVSGSVNQAAITIAGLQLSAATLNYKNDTFSAATASVALPGSIGGGGATINNLRITKDGVYIDGGGGTFTVADREIGSVLSLTKTDGSLLLDGKGNFRFRLTTTLKIQKIEAVGGDNSISTSATLYIRKGRVTGDVTGFGLAIAGLGIEVKQPQFLDNRITAQMASLTLPEKLGGSSTALYNLEIGGTKGFSVGGGRFTLPDFSMGTVGVQNVQAEFYRTAEGNYSIQAKATFNFEAFSIQGSFKVLYVVQPPDLRLQQVKLAFNGSVLRGTAIPIADTGLYITRVTGEFDLSNGTLELRFGMKVASAATMDLPIVGETALVGAEGEVYVKAQPFELRTQAESQILGLTVNEVNLRLTSTSVTLSATTEWQIARATLMVAFGEAADGKFTFYGKAVTEIGLRKGSIGCLLFACLPPTDFTLDRRAYDFGRFRHDGNSVYGIRAAYSAFGFDFFAFARVAPTFGLDAGFNLDAYKPVLPALNGLSAATSADAPSTYDVQVSGQATELLVLEAVQEPNRAAPEEVTVTGPAGISFTKQLQYQSENGDTRIYTISFAQPAHAVGLWRLTPQPGNQLMVWGSDPAAQATRFTAAIEGGAALAPIEQQPNPRVTLGGSEALTVAWEATDDEPGMELEVYAEDTNGVRFPIAADSSDTAASLSGSARYPLALPSGTYIITLAINDGRNITTYARMEPVVVKDTTGPAAPAGLRAEARPDGSVLLIWNGPAAPDHQGYQVRVDGREPIPHRGAVTRTELFGLAPSSRHTASVAAYDLSGNVGPAASVEVTLPEFTVAALAPRRGEQLSALAEVAASLAVPATSAELSVTDGKGSPVAGSSEPLLLELAPEELALLGARFVPEAGAFAPGAYTAHLSVTGANGASHSLSWPFTVVELPALTTSAALTPEPVNGWHRNPTVTLSTDGGAGVTTEYRLDDGAWQRYTGPFQVTGDGERVLQFRSTAEGGAAEEARTLAFKNDGTAPALAPAVTPSVVLLNGSATVSPNAMDAASGVAEASCAAVDTSSPGEKQVSCTATDKAGNRATARATYRVGYGFGGFLAPVDNPPMVNTGRAGRTYPVKWQLKDAAGAYVSDLSVVASIKVQSIACSNLAPNPTSPLDITATGATSLRYDAAANQYVYTWATPGPGCYALNITLKGGQTFNALFSLR